MIERTNTSEDVWIAELAKVDTPEARQDAMKGSVEDWATESLLAARHAYEVPETGKRLKAGEKLRDGYLAANLLIMRERLYLASVRLAMVLNGAFSEN